LIQQNAVSIDGEKVGEATGSVNLDEAAPFVIKVGKRRFARVTR
jgi:tyrosyl-tRNA synthetase